MTLPTTDGTSNDGEGCDVAVADESVGPVFEFPCGRCGGHGGLCAFCVRGVVCVEMTDAMVKAAHSQVWSNAPEATTRRFLAAAMEAATPQPGDAEGWPSTAGSDGRPSDEVLDAWLKQNRLALEQMLAWCEDMHLRRNPPRRSILHRLLRRAGTP